MQNVAGLTDQMVSGIKAPPSTNAEMARLTDELSAGEESIAALQSEIDNCRSETLHLRSKAASVALSLEGIKDELQLLLQNEAEIRANFRLASNEDADGAEPTRPVSDHATLCALNGQLDATKFSVEKAVHDRDDLLRTMSEEGSIHVGLEEDYAASPHDVSAFTFFEKLLRVDEPDSDSTNDDIAESDLIDKLNAQSMSRSSFRDDHARIWRDSTLPNVALLQWERDASGERVVGKVTCGVVSERLFAGLTSYTSTNEKGEVGVHCYLSGFGEAEQVTAEQFEAVKGVYSTLLLEDATMPQHKIKIIAPRQALERVVQLVQSAAHRGSLTSRSPTAPPPTPENQPKSSKQESSDDQQHSLNKVSPPKRAGAAATSASLRRPGPQLSERSSVLSSSHFRFLVNECIPVRFQECDLLLKYSTNNHGMSVHTLYERVKNVSPTIVALRDNKGRVFGCYAATPWKSTAPRYYGTGECFVFSCKPRLAVYKWNRRKGNHFFQFSHHNILAMGGGGGGRSHYALWLDEDLIRGTTAACSTFDSPPLASKAGDTDDKVDFDIVVLEVWTVIPRHHLNHT